MITVILVELTVAAIFYKCCDSLSINDCFDYEILKNVSQNALVNAIHSHKVSNAFEE